MAAEAPFLPDSFLPPPLLRLIAEQGHLPARPVEQVMDAAVLFTDISGFTALTERFASRGAEGVEEISQALQTYFTTLLRLVTGHGGEVLKFAGDALLAQWPLAGPQPQRDQVLRAARCALLIQQTLHHFEAAPGVFLNTRLALAHGPVRMCLVGDPLWRRETLFTGAPFRTLGRLQDLGIPGEVLLAPSTWQTLSGLAEGQARGRLAVQLTAIAMPPPTTPLRLPALDPQHLDAVFPLLPAAIRDRLASGHSAWLSELRPVTVLFVQLSSVGPETPLDRLQEALTRILQVLQHYEGDLNKVSTDDKGVSLVAAFGLPPTSHEDDAARGALAGMDIYQALQQLGVRCSVGVASGMAYCGVIGDQRRREYTLIGDAVNTAARLMLSQQAPVLCDQNTFREARRHVAFERLGSLHLKGKTQAVATYRPAGRLLTPVATVGQLVGREEEQARLQQHLHALLTTGASQVVWLEGEAGIGKSALAATLIAAARAREVLVLPGEGEQVEQHRPLHAWRGVFQTLLVTTGALLPDAHDASPEDLALIRLAPLLNPVLDQQLPDNEATAQMRGQVRAENTYHLLTRLLQNAAAHRPLLIVLDDAHWMDAASWQLTLRVARQVEHVFLLLLTRPMRTLLPAAADVLRLPGSHRLVLAPLTPEQTVQIAMQRLGVDEMPAEVVRFIRERSAGHPFFSEELVYALRDVGAIRVEGRRAVLVRTAFEDVSLPESLHALILSRVDRLNPPQQLTLKVASVIGRLFPCCVLQDVYPIPRERPRLPEYLQVLEARQLTVRAAAEPDPAYMFRHTLLQEATYHLLPGAQRRQLHRAVAQWYEARQAARQDVSHALLAHHWDRAGEPLRAIRAYLQAGEQALRAGAYADAARDFSRALQLAPQAPDLPLLSQGRLQRLRGQALLSMGHLQEALPAFRQAAQTLRDPVPAGRPALWLHILGQIGLQAAHFLSRRRRRHDAGRERELARLYSALAEAYYLSNRPIHTVLAALKALNHAERLGPSPELALAYAGACVIAGLASLHSVADRYARLAQHIAQQSGDADTRIQVALRTGVYLVGVGAWAQAAAVLQPALRQAADLGDHHRHGECLGVAAMAAFYGGRLGESAALYRRLRSLAEQHANPLQLAWSLDGLALIALRRQAVDEARPLAAQSETALQRTQDPAQQLVHQAVLALLHLAEGRHEEALTTARRLADMIESTRPTVYSTLEGFAAPATVFLALAEGPTSPHLSAGRQALQALARFCRVFPLGEPRLAWLEGQLAWRRGRPRQAERRWLEAMHIAEARRLPYELAQAMLSLAAHFPHHQELRPLAEDILRHMLRPSREP